MAPNGVPFISSGLSRSLGNIIIGGTNVPPAPIHITQVIVDPRSADVTVPIYFLPLSASISGIFDGTTEIPVPSTLYTLVTGYWILSKELSNKSKNTFTLSLLNSFIQAIDAPIGRRKER